MRYLSQIIHLPPNASLIDLLIWLRGEMKKSRFKIWLRAFLFIQFSAFIFFVTSPPDIFAGSGSC
jgi:hypothetical protein